MHCVLCTKCYHGNSSSCCVYVLHCDVNLKDVLIISSVWSVYVLVQRCVLPDHEVLDQVI